ncbi:hypothetical protein B0A50_05982 [Salinomyces thailandicus]|uniref:Uncharacterized protein n=1 Tax=Salinomyces thailandicus TaxID=706561 RepID=A0A4U0TQ62_9PEZI|nr:hypothetical protein B0A50_05982 [Salinomyces thailandica]
MGTPAWAIPLGVLAVVVVLGFLFVWWWFPRLLLKGQRSDMDAVDAENAVRNIGLTDSEGNTPRGAMIEDPETGEWRKPTLEERVKALHNARAYEDRGVPVRIM